MEKSFWLFLVVRRYVNLNTLNSNVLRFRECFTAYTSTRQVFYLRSHKRAHLCSKRVSIWSESEITAYFERSHDARENGECEHAQDKRPHCICHEHVHERIVLVWKSVTRSAHTVSFCRRCCESCSRWLRQSPFWCCWQLQRWCRRQSVFFRLTGVCRGRWHICRNIYKQRVHPQTKSAVLITTRNPTPAFVAGDGRETIGEVSSCTRG